MDSSPFIHERDASNKGDVSQNEMDQIASQMPSWEDEANIGVGSRDEDNDGPEIRAGAWVEGVWQDPQGPHPLPPREGRSMVDFDPDYSPNPSEVMPNIIIIQYLMNIFMY